jgi:hypothetical protein
MPVNSIIFFYFDPLDRGRGRVKMVRVGIDKKWKLLVRKDRQQQYILENWSSILAIYISHRNLKNNFFYKKKTQ